MKKLFLCFFTAFIMVLGLLSTRDRADGLTFDLNAIIDGSGIAGYSYFGTITLTDKGDHVDILVDLVDTPAEEGSHKVIQGCLNYNDRLFDSTTHEFDTTSKAGIIEDENPLKAGGYPGTSI
jgi:hypothetical protein